MSDEVTLGEVYRLTKETHEMVGALDARLRPLERTVSNHSLLFKGLWTLTGGGILAWIGSLFQHK